MLRFLPLRPLIRGCYFVWFVGMLVLSSRTASAQSAISFADATQESGIDFQHTDGSSGRRYVVEPFTAGLAIFDYDGDGREDVYLLNGANLPGTEQGAGDPAPVNRLYRNIGNMRFEDRTIQSGLGDAGFAMGVVGGDYDNDGDLDLYVTNFGPNVLFSNNGDGTFSDITAISGTALGDKFGAGAVMLDIEGDGDLDLYVANYQKFTFDQHIQRMIAGRKFHPGPADYPPESDHLLRNDGDGRFTDVSKESGIADWSGTGMGAIASDVDGDGDADILVANDSCANFLFINDGHGKFEESGLLSGFAFDRAGKTNGNMGIDGGDIDGDGRVDFVSTTYQNELPVVIKNEGDGFLSDVTSTVGMPTMLAPHVNWGCSLSDFDNDGDLDIFIACGHFMDNIRFIDDRTEMKVRDFVLENVGRGRFLDAGPLGASSPPAVESSRGSAVGDLDSDGDLDVVVLNFNAPTTVLENQQATGHGWLNVRLIGTQSSRFPAGARLEAICGGQLQVAELYSGRGYQSHFGGQLHLGLKQPGPAATIELKVRWPSGVVSRRLVERWNRTITIVEPAS